MGWLKKIWYIHITEYYLAKERNDMLINAINETKTLKTLC